MQERNAARVFPDPVGAAIRTSEPDWIAGQACCCTSVGSPMWERNHSEMSGWNWASDMSRYHTRADSCAPRTEMRQGLPNHEGIHVAAGNQGSIQLSTAAGGCEENAIEFDGGRRRFIRSIYY